MTYSPSATRGEEEAWTAEFVAADAAGLAYTTAYDMPRAETLRVDGYRGFMRAIARADNQRRKQVRATLRTVGEDVHADATTFFMPISAKSAAGYRTRVRQTGIAVQQSLRKTTGRRPDYGGLQMRRALLPALAANAPELEQKMERAMEQVCDHFDRPA